MRPTPQSEILLKTEKATLIVEALGDGKVRVNSSAWEDAKVIGEGEVLEIRALGWARKQVAVLRRPRTPDRATDHPPE
jgi:hypothetical protein